ncbi:redoxin domain-containing protein [Oceanirhabdus sp. W0125-5]|uniref:redoxin domain-containing protein n=1 Tax=Oceanirhabdus sp. W0125-5 TaxID=2999116 RepID=UPI0022F31D72|nr:redoxin domain-containing protein [Oceanirhabdus sp. W0125-5]WBW99828.1 redoxin domain-containing protein [Oceanirhabdus sp. W0125-5]
MNLSEQLKKIHEEFSKSAPQEVLDTFERASQQLAEEKIEEKALKVGDKMPSFELKNALGKVIKSSELLAKGPLVMNFYRGAW